METYTDEQFEKIIDQARKKGPKLRIRQSDVCCNETMKYLHKWYRNKPDRDFTHQIYWLNEKRGRDFDLNFKG